MLTWPYIIGDYAKAASCYFFPSTCPALPQSPSPPVAPRSEPEMEGWDVETMYDLTGQQWLQERPSWIPGGSAVTTDDSNIGLWLLGGIGVILLASMVRR